jgi:hypothetical protein
MEELRNVIMLSSVIEFFKKYHVTEYSPVLISGLGICSWAHKVDAPSRLPEDGNSQCPK